SRSSANRYGSQRPISPSVGLLKGGAHRTAAVTYASRRLRPSPRCSDVGRSAKPAWWSASKSQSPLRSPVNIRPVRLPPWDGGAGADPSEAPEFRQGVRAAVLAGWRVLAAGGGALDAVEGAVRALEDDPRFNAGRGSVLTRDGTIETDASIMEGDRLQCGAVA